LRRIDSDKVKQELSFEPEGTIHLAPEAQRAYDAIVRPNAIVPITRYFMDNWLPLLGTSRAWVTLAFRQVAFVSRSGNHEVPIRTTLRKLGRWCGLSHVRVHQMLKDPGLLTWFVRNPKGDLADRQIPRSEPTTFMVRSDIPLTPEDQARLTLWLAERNPSDDSDWILATEEAIEARDTKLPKDHPIPEVSLTVQQIVYAQRGDDTPLPPSLDEACTELHSRWVQPERVTLTTHYFIVRWLPDLSPGLGWLILRLRSRSYLQEERQVGQVWISGGWKGLSASIGVSRKSLSRWVNSDIASLFFKRRVDTKDPTNRRNILLYVRMSEPIHPDDEEEYHSLVKGQDLTSPIPLEGQDLTTLSTTGGQSLTAGGKQSTELSRNLTGPGQELPAPQQNLTREEPRLNKLGTILNALSPSKLISKSNLQELKQPETIQTETKIQPESKTSLLSGEVLDTVSESGDELDREKSKPSSNRDIPAGSKVWNAAKSQLQLELSKAIYDTWLKDIEVIEFGNNALVLGAANDYASDWLNERMSNKIERIITGILGREVMVHFMVRDDVEG
jgi:hypothetical protein